MNRPTEPARASRQVWSGWRRPSCGLLLCLALVAPLAWAQQPAALDMDLAQLLRQQPKDVPLDMEVSTASRFAQSAAQAPSVTYVITAADIERYGLRNMSDILRTLPGLYVTHDGLFTYVGARGLSRPGDFNARLLFLVDGVRVNENIYDAGLLGGNFFVDAELIERVEYAPGPGSALYGNNAFFGVVNVTTKRADKLRGVEARASLDSQGLRQLRASWGHRSESGWEGWLAASDARQQRKPLAFEVAPADRHALRELQWSHGQRLFGSFNAGGWALRGGASRYTDGLPAVLDPGPPLALAQLRAVSENEFLALSHERDLTPDLGLFASVSAKRSRYTRHDPFSSDTGLPLEFRSESSGRWSNWDLRLSSRHWADHHLMAGVEFQHDSQQRIVGGVVGEAPLQEFFGSNRRLGLFVQDEWHAAPQHRLVLGLRQDRDDLGSRSLNPRLAWVWQTLPEATFKLMYGSAFRAANLYEFQVNYPWEVATPTPERVRTLEAAWEQALTPQLQVRMSLYASRLLDLISINTHDLPVFENSPPMRNEGLELGLERRWDDGAQLRLGLSLQRTRDHLGAALSNSPESMLKLLYSRPLLGDALQASLQLLAMSRRQSSGVELPGYLLGNLNLLWRPRLDLDLSLGAYNLADCRYYDRPGSEGEPVRQEGRTLRLALTWRFGL